MHRGINVRSKFSVYHTPLFLVIDWVFLDVFMGDELCEGPRWDIVSVVKNTPSDKEEGVKALPFPEGGMVNAKFEAHISVSDRAYNLSVG